MYKYLMCRNGLFSVVPSDGARGSGHKFKMLVFWGFFLMCEGVQNQSKLSREVVESLSVEILKT